MRGDFLAILIALVACVLAVACIAWMWVAREITQLRGEHSEIRVRLAQAEADRDLLRERMGMVDDISRIERELASALDPSQPPRSSALGNLASYWTAFQHRLDAPKNPRPTSFDRVLKDDADDFPEKTEEPPGTGVVRGKGIVVLG